MTRGTKPYFIPRSMLLDWRRAGDGHRYTKMNHIAVYLASPPKLAPQPSGPAPRHAAGLRYDDLGFEQTFNLTQDGNTHLISLFVYLERGQFVDRHPIQHGDNFPGG